MNLNNLDYGSVRWSKVPGPTGEFTMEWCLPCWTPHVTFSSELTKLWFDLREAEVTLIKWMNSGKGYWNWFGVIEKKAERGAIYHQICLELTAKGAGRWKIRPMRDNYGLPLAVIFDQKGWLVPSVLVPTMTQISVYFFKRDLSDFAWNDQFPVIALGFTSGVCDVRPKNITGYQKRLYNRITNA